MTVIMMSRNELTRLRMLIDVADGQLSVADATGLETDRLPGFAAAAAREGILGAERVERRLAAILAADVAGYSRLMERDEVGTLARLRTLRRDLIDPNIADHKGRIVRATES